MTVRLACLCIGFIFGSIPSGVLIARTKGVDLRHQGSGNVGTTNVLRTMGRGYAALTLLCDILKSVVPILITQHFFGGDTAIRYLITLYTGLGAVLGHDFSPFLGFNGGKGIATSGGLILMTDPRLFIINLVTIFGVTIAVGYVSLGSMIAAATYFIFSLVSVLTGFIPGWWFYPQYYDGAHSMEVLVVSFIIAGIAVYRHKGNIKRLLSGNENKVSLSGKKA